MAQHGIHRNNTKVVRIFGVNVHDVAINDVLSLIQEKISKGERAVISHVNSHTFNIAYENPWFRTFLNGNDLVLAEGWMVKLGARILRQRLAENFQPARWIPHLFERARQHNYTFYLLGSRRGLEQIGVNDLLQRYPNLSIVGAHHGEFDKQLGADESETVVRYINEAQANILLMGFGTPHQEKWLQDHWSRLQVNVVIIGDSLIE